MQPKPNETERRGGTRPGAGRPSRTEPKSKPIWCGQLTDEERELILTVLNPDERREALLEAVARKEPFNPLCGAQNHD